MTTDAKQEPLVQDLKEVGLKITMPRLKILKLLEMGRDPGQKRHWRAEEIHQQLQRDGEEVGLATVYRVLTQFEKSNIVIRHHFDGDYAVYEINPQTHHDHLVCMVCGYVEEFFDETIEARQLEVARRLGHDLIDHSLSLFIRCKTCKAQGR
jgi:Fur family ferric uptake transcriptional regulator